MKHLFDLQGYRAIVTGGTRGWGTPEDMKGVTVFLAFHGSDYINGAAIPVGGGYLVK